MLEFNDLLLKAGLDPEGVVVFRHKPRPEETRLRKVFSWLAAEHPDLFNAYQQTQSPRVEKMLLTASHVAAFIGDEPGRALFVGLYRVGASKPLSFEAFWAKPQHIALRDYDFQGFTADEHQKRDAMLWFELEPLPTLAGWSGKLSIEWTGQEINWCRWADGSRFPIRSIAEESRLVAKAPDWRELVISWPELQTLPQSWREDFRRWRGVYLIFDQSDRRYYVGSAYGADNILGRWLNYARSGDGGNRLLRECDPRNFQFSVLQLVAPTEEAEAVIAAESSWKRRLHSRAPFGLNDN
jgi:hypothetical protein